MRNIFLIFIIILQFSCDGSKRIFKDLDTTGDNLKICIFPLNLNIGEETCALPLKNGILIDDQQIIKTILNEWEYNENAKICFPEFKVYILKGNVLHYSLSFNRCLDNVQTGHGSFVFEPNKLLKHKDFFNPLIGIEVQFEKLEECRSFKNIIENEAFILVEGADSLFEWEKYRGTVQIKKEGIKNLIGLDAEDLINRELQSNKNYELINWTYNKGDASIIMELMTDSSIYLPKTYSSLRGYQEFQNISFNLIGVDKERAYKLAADNKIKLQSIKEIQF